jgi:hypothetical protein
MPDKPQIFSTQYLKVGEGESIATVSYQCCIERDHNFQPYLTADGHFELSECANCNVCRFRGIGYEVTFFFIPVYPTKHNRLIRILRKDKP